MALRTGAGPQPVVAMRSCATWIGPYADPLKKGAAYKHFVLVLFLVPALWGLTEGFPAAGAEMLRLEASADAMGTAYSVVLYGEDRRKLESASGDALEEARRIDLLLSNYKPESEWSRINREAAGHPVAISAELFDLLAACADYSRRSEGTFDITVGPLMKIWGFYKGTGRLPEAREVKQAMGRIGYRNIVLDASKRTVFFAKPGLDLDPGGVGKGYAVDRMAAILRKDGIQSALISGGGSSIYCLGAPPGEPGWKIAIKDPASEFGQVAEVVLRDESLSTSGTSEKYFVSEGRSWSHIMDPRTGYPSPGTLSVSVVAPLTLDSEVWAKPYFILGREWTASHKPGNFRVFFCNEVSDPAAAKASDRPANKETAKVSPEKDKADQSCAWLQ